LDGVLNTARQKVKNLRQRPKGTLFFLDRASPYWAVEIRARAEVEPDPDYTHADRVSAKDGGADPRSMDRPGEERAAVRFVPIELNTFG
jgi:hypothetical protein